MKPTIRCLLAHLPCFPIFTNENIIIIGKVNVDVVIKKTIAWGFSFKFGNLNVTCALIGLST
jgi:hypothetical protein